MEFNDVYDVSFKVYNQHNNVLRKLEKTSDFSQKTPEQVAQAYFFAFDNTWLEKLFLEKENAIKREEEHYQNIKKIKSKDVYIQLLQKMNYVYQGQEMCYIGYIPYIEGEPFPFPMLLSLKKTNNQWFIKDRSNQFKLLECLSTFKPCVLSAIMEGNSLNNEINNIIATIKNKDGIPDFINLYDELQKIGNDKEKTDRLTLSKDIFCENILYKEEINAKVAFTGVFESVSMKKYTKSDQEEVQNLISLIKKENDSVFINEKIDIKHNNTVFSLFKYTLYEGVKTKKGVYRISKNKPENVVNELIFLYENLDSVIFNDLTPSINGSKFENTLLYKNTRGVYDVLNISKLYDLYVTDKYLFKNYIYK